MPQPLFNFYLSFIFTPTHAETVFEYLIKKYFDTYDINNLMILSILLAIIMKECIKDEVFLTLFCLLSNSKVFNYSKLTAHLDIQKIIFSLTMIVDGKIDQK